MKKTLCLCMLLTAVGPLAGCSPPRGAALSSQILRAQNSEDPGFAVVPVARANVAQVAAWPVTGWNGAYHWVGNNKGADTPVIRAGDRLNLTIFDSQENSLLAGPGQNTTVIDGLAVASDGSVFVPYLGNVVINGMTPPQARDYIQGAMTPLVPTAQVVLTVDAGRQNSVDLVTGVASPGTYPLPDRNYTVLGLIAQGGGIAPGLRNPLVRLIRGSETYEIRADRLFADGSMNTVLRGGDKLLVQEDKRFFTTLGATGAEKLVYFEKERVTALEAMSLAGGLADGRADLKGVLVLREYPAAAVRADGTGPAMTQVVFTFDLTSADGLFAARGFQINPNDTVLVTESSVVLVQGVVGLIRSTVGLQNMFGS